MTELRPYQRDVIDLSQRARRRQERAPNHPRHANGRRQNHRRPPNHQRRGC